MLNILIGSFYVGGDKVIIYHKQQTQCLGLM